jgi:hypothetical protein
MKSLWKKSDGSSSGGNQISATPTWLGNDLPQFDPANVKNGLARNLQRKQGPTVPTDFMFTEPKHDADVAWNNRAKSASATTGIGVYYTIKVMYTHYDVCIYDKSIRILFAIQAEARAFRWLSFATVAQVHNHVFFTACKNLAMTMARPGVNHQSFSREIIRHTIQFQNIARPLKFSTYHISKEINGVADTLAHHTTRSSRLEPTSLCRNSAHSNSICIVLA